MKNITIIGAGQLGSRHLQAMASVVAPLNIKVLDPAKESLDLARARFEEVNSNFKGAISYCSSIDDLDSDIEVVIIATNSKIRRKIIEDLVSKKNVKYLILEKVLFMNLDDYDIVEQLLKDKGIKTWVNCPRRMYESYKNLRQQIDGPAVFTAEGINWGMGCNSIHLLDIFAFLTNETDLIEGQSFLDKEIINSKREGYIEFTGAINLYSKKGDLFHINSYKDGDKPFSIKVETKDGFWILNDAKGEIRFFGKENNWEGSTEILPSPFQSQLTNKAVESILNTGTCELTSFSESVVLHKYLFKIFLNHYNTESNNYNNKECAIT
jgi:hypothetical protein